jgi:sec-independent protein translocase protein TatA
MMPGPAEMMIIGVIAVLLFGKKLPSTARALGSSFIEFKRGLQGIDSGVADVAQDLQQVNQDIKQVNQDIKKAV